MSRNISGSITYFFHCINMDRTKMFTLSQWFSELSKMCMRRSDTAGHGVNSLWVETRPWESSGCFEVLHQGCLIAPSNLEVSPNTKGVGPGSASLSHSSVDFGFVQVLTGHSSHAHCLQWPLILFEQVSVWWSSSCLGIRFRVLYGHVFSILASSGERETAKGLSGSKLSSFSTCYKGPVLDLRFGRVAMHTKWRQIFKQSV